MMEIIGVGLITFLEALSIVVCLHYLYGERISFDRISVIYLMIDTFLMVMINGLHLKPTWSLIIFPLMLLYTGFRFGFQLRKLIINDILEKKNGLQ